MTAPTLELLEPGVAYEAIPGVWAGVRPACPYRPWRGARGVAAGTHGRRASLAADLARHVCTSPDRETT